jgi:hypothetical protein
MEQVLEYIRKELRFHLGLDDTQVFLESPAILSDESAARGMTISLINAKVSAYQGSALRPPDLLDSLELHLLFAFRFKRYETSLAALYRVLRLFHARPAYSAATTHPQNPFPEHVEKLFFTLLPLESDALSDLWGMLGGSLYPSALYSVRMVRSKV